MPVYFVFIFLISVIGLIFFSVLDSIIKIFWKKYSLSLHLVEKDTDPAPDPDRWAIDADSDPDPAKWYRSDRIRIHNTAEWWADQEIFSRNKKNKRFPFKNWPLSGKNYEISGGNRPFIYFPFPMDTH